jgi:hypothetical protein
VKIHSDVLTYQDIWDAAQAAGPEVFVRASQRGSRKRSHGFEVSLTGTSTRRPNNREAWRETDDYAATWDEWGMFLAYLFDKDPDAIVPGVYESGDDFHFKTGERFYTLTPEQQHGGAGHRWEFYTVGEFHCKNEECDAIMRR